MMISPESFKMNNETKTLKELINIKNDLIEQINNYEKRKIFTDNPILIDEDRVKPSPQTVYRMNIEYLVVILELILDKEKDFQYGEMVFPESFDNN